MLYRPVVQQSADVYLNGSYRKGRGCHSYGFFNFFYGEASVDTVPLENLTSLGEVPDLDTIIGKVTFVCNIILDTFT